VSAFEYISVATSIVMGLGMTRILQSVVVAYRGRREHAVDALSLLWAGWVFLAIIQYWWSVFELDAAGLVTSWSLVVFLLLLGMAVCQYVASALILPGEACDMKEYARGDGRTAYLALALYCLLGVVANVTLFGSSLLDTANVLVYVMVAGFVWTALRPPIWVRAGILTVEYALIAWGYAMAAPTSYPG